MKHIKLYEHFILESVSYESFEKIINSNKSLIYDGIMKIGKLLFSDSNQGFVHSPFKDIEFGVLDIDENDENNESVVDDAYYLGVIFDNKEKKVLELPGYKKLEYEQMTPDFINKWYKNRNNKNKYLISYDASIDDISIIMPLVQN